MSRFFLLCASALALSAPVLAAPKATYRKLHAVKRDVYDLQMVFPQWRSKAPALRTANWYYRQRTYAQWTMVRRTTREALANTPPGWKPAGGHLYYYLNPFISIQKPDLVSGYLFADHFDGGIHPNTETRPINVGLVAGKAQLLSITDICQPGQSQAVAAKVFAKLGRVPAAAWVQPQTRMLTPKSAELTKTFVITPTGLLFVFDPYVAGPYSNGEIRVKLPFSELREELNPNGPLKPVLANYGF